MVSLFQPSTTQNDVPPSDTTVESFQVRLEGWSELLQAQAPLQYLEDRLWRQLHAPARLLRWAVVRVDLSDPAQPFWCEGAYLKN